MHLHQRVWTQATGWSGPADRTASPQLVLAFGASSVLGGASHLAALRDEYAGAHVLACSTAGEIHGESVLDDSLVVTAIEFEHTRVVAAAEPIRDANESRSVGAALARRFDPDGLVHLFVISEGLHVNGSELVPGIVGELPPHVGVTGGLAGDGGLFAETLVALDGPAVPNQVAAIGFYGDRLRVGYGCMGGWDTFGPDRLITRASANVLYELDGVPALDLYKRYLGPHADDLPASALLFPLSLRSNDDAPDVVRTILSVDEEAGTMTFAGDMPSGRYARLMRANFDRLIDGAAGAGSLGINGLRSASPELALLVSCVGRKLVLKQRVEEEIEGVRSALASDTVIAGFYSYGEISPFSSSARCELHNQTMTVTTFSEV